MLEARREDRQRLLSTNADVEVSIPLLDLGAKD
jgi:hypothetical protein